MLMEGQWERKAVYTFYLELIRDLLHLSMYLCFFLVIFMNYEVPLHLIRELYETFRNFKVRVADYILYRKITSNMNDRFPDATPEELNTGDATCIICREEMATAKKTHLWAPFSCALSSILVRTTAYLSYMQSFSCPTGRWNSCICGATGSASSTGIGGGTSPQGSAGGAANTHLTQHQARIQAAAAAAAIYEKSYVYPSANTLAWSPGYAVLPRGSTSSSDSSNTESISGGQTNVTYPQVSQGAFVPLRAFSSVNLKDGDKSGNDLNGYGSHLEVQERLLKQQIEVLQSQLLQLNHHKSDSTNPSNPSPADNKGKGIASSSSENDRNAEEVKMKREKIQ
ncbi:hypothetical protein MKX03_003041 [Papaver bracteatum]|nr:hypothetical protein MKX03_003041 [Papaver bracteatum]